MKRYMANRGLHGRAVLVCEGPLHVAIQERRWLAPVTEETIPPTDSFEWGDTSIGSYLLAASILYDLVGHDEAMTHLNRFRREIIAGLHPSGWMLRGDWIKEKLRDWSKEVQP